MAVDGNGGDGNAAVRCRRCAHIFLPNGDVYEGDRVKGVAGEDGHGKYTFTDSDVYKGEWKEVQRDGHDKLKRANGDIKEGRFENLGQLCPQRRHQSGRRSRCHHRGRHRRSCRGHSHCCRSLDTTAAAVTAATTASVAANAAAYLPPVPPPPLRRAPPPNPSPN